MYNSTKNLIKAANLLKEAEENYKKVRSDKLIDTLINYKIDTEITKVLKAIESLVENAVDNCENLNLA